MQFGLQTGFQRFLTVGIISGRCRIWNQFSNIERTPAADEGSTNSSDNLNVISISSTNGKARAAKQLQVLTDLVTGIPVLNTESAVEEFESRVKRAKARAKVVQRLLKDSAMVVYEEDAVRVGDSAGGEETIEDTISGFESIDMGSHDHSYDPIDGDQAVLEIEFT